MLENLVKTVSEDSVGKYDYLTNIRNLHMDSNDGHLEFINTNEVKGQGIKDIGFLTNDWADSQIYSKLNMPGHYFKRIKDESPDLVAKHFNYWAQKSDDEIMLRTKIRNNSGVIRGVVSNKYSVIDNDNVVNILKEILRIQESYELASTFIDERRLHIRVILNDITDYADIIEGKPDNLQVGLDIVNSEVGAASLNIKTLIWRLVCGNGLRMWQTESQLSQRHIYVKQEEIYINMIESFASSILTGKKLLQQFMKTISVKIDSPLDAIEGIGQKYNFTNEFISNAKSLYEGNSTAYGVINSITAASRDLNNEKRLENETIAGKLVELTPEQWKKISKIND